MTESLRDVIGEELLFKTKKIFIRYFQRISLLPECFNDLAGTIHISTIILLT
jgi:hypothetical protein